MPLELELGLRLRRLESRDRAALASIIRSSENFTEAEIECALSLVDYCLSNPQQSDYLIVSAVDSAGRLVGYACYGPDAMAERVYDLYWIVVAPGSRGRGVGTLLLGAVEREAARAAARMLVVEGPERAIGRAGRGLFAKHGFSEAARIRDLYAAGNDKIILIKKLPAASTASRPPAAEGE